MATKTQSVYIPGRGVTSQTVEDTSTSGISQIGKGVSGLQKKAGTEYDAILQSINDLKKYVSDDELSKLLKSSAIQAVQTAGISPETIQQQIGADQGIVNQRYDDLLKQLDEHYNQMGQFGSQSHQAAKQRLLQDREGALAESRRKWTMWGETEGQNQLMQSLGIGQGISQGTLGGLSQISAMEQNARSGQVDRYMQEIYNVLNQISQGSAVNTNLNSGQGHFVKEGIGGIQLLPPTKKSMLPKNEISAGGGSGGGIDYTYDGKT